MKRKLTLLLALVLVFAMTSQAFAATATTAIEPYITYPYVISSGNTSDGEFLMVDAATGALRIGRVEEGRFVPGEETTIEYFYDFSSLGEDISQDPYIPFWDDDFNTGIKDPDGNVIIAPNEYDDVNLQSSKTGAVELEKDGLYGFSILSTGQSLPIEYSMIFPIGSDYQLFKVSKDDLSGVVTIDGKVIIPVEYEWVNMVFDSEDKLAFYTIEDSDGCSVMMPDGRYLIEKTPGMCFVSGFFPEGGKDLFMVELMGAEGEETRTAVVDRNGEFLFPFTECSMYSQSKYINVTYPDDTCSVLDAGLNRIFPEYDYVSFCSDDSSYFIAGKGGKYTVITEAGAKVFDLPGEFDPQYTWYLGGDYFRTGAPGEDDAEAWTGTETVLTGKGEAVFTCESCGALYGKRYLTFAKGECYGVADLTTGKVVIPAEYDYVFDYDDTSDGQLVVRKDEKYGVVDVQGKVIVPVEFEDVNPNAAGAYVTTSQDYHYGLYSASGEMLLDTKYSFPQLMANNRLYLICSDEGYGLMSLDGKFLLPCGYALISNATPDGSIIMFGTKDNKWGLVDASGNVLAEPVYDGLFGNMGESDRYNFYIKGEDGSTEGFKFGQLKVNDNPFTDVKEGDYFYQAVQWARHNGVTSGTSATRFSPDTNCNRAQVVTFLWNQAGKPEPETTVNPFKDVKETDWYYKAVLWAVEKGITSGTSATTFSPMTTCTNAHVLTFLWNYMGQPETTGDTNWYSYGMNWAKAGGLTYGIAGADDPTAPCPRKNIVAFMFRYFDK